MHIVHLTPYYAPAYPFGGVVRAVEGMARAMSKRGHTVTVLTTDAASPGERLPPPHQLDRDGVRVLRARNLFARGTLNLSSPVRLGRLAAPVLAQADVLHIHEFRTVENLLVTPLAVRHGLPIFLSPHGTLTLTTGRGGVKAVWDRLLSPAVARRIDTVIGLTADETAEARAAWSTFGTQAQFATIPNGVDLDTFAHLPDPAAFRSLYNLGDGPVCLFMGRLHPRKGAHLLAEAFQGANIPNARLVIAGPDEGGRALIEPFIDSRVVLTGYLDGTERLAALAAADIFALPAEGEGLSMVVLEALACGLPVLLTPGCHLPEAAAAGAGIEIARTPDALAEGLRFLLTDLAQLEPMRQAARALVRDQFVWEKVVSSFERLYSSRAEQGYNEESSQLKFK